MIINRIPENWRDALDSMPNNNVWRDNINNLGGFLHRECKDRHRYYPRGRDIFAAFEATRFDRVRVVIIGQDPYPEKANATGLAFSAPIKIPLKKARSVKKMYRSITTDLRGEMPIHGNLDHWARQGVLLLNRVLTIRRVGKKNMHNCKEWLDFTQAVVQALINSQRPIHFMLWGNPARKLAVLLECTHHYVYQAVHPMAPVPANQNFYSFHNFLDLDTALGEDSIDWFPPPPEEAQND